MPCPCRSEMVCQPAGGPGWGQIELQTIVPSQRGLGHRFTRGYGLLEGHSAEWRTARHAREGRECAWRAATRATPPVARVRRKNQAASLRASSLNPGPGTTPGGLGVAPPQRDPPKPVPSPSSAHLAFPSAEP